MKLSFNHLFQTYRSSMGLSSLARQSALPYASGTAVHISPHPCTHHFIYHWLRPSPHPANPLCLPLTLAQAAALLPGPISIPEELLRFVLYRDVEGVPDIWVVQVPHRQHLQKKSDNEVCFIIQSVFMGIYGQQTVHIFKSQSKICRVLTL